MNLDEFIEPHIKEILLGIEIKEISNFVNDMKATFKKFVPLPEEAHLKGDVKIKENIIFRLIGWLKVF